MPILVAYGSRYGATRGIAERLGESLRGSGLDVDVLEATPVLDASSYDAFVIGSAAYRGAWLRGPVELVQRHVAVLAERPVWLFSSGPLGRSLRDDRGRDLMDLSRPRQFTDFENALAPQDMRVFYGALDPGRLRLADRMVRRLPAGRRLLPAGDFRNWEAIDGWGREIVEKLGGSVRRREA